MKLLALFLWVCVATAQDYPSRPVRVVVPLSPGGFADTPTRMLTPRLSELLGKQFSVMAGISHASFQQKNYLMVYHILHAYFTQPAPAYVGSM